jgi:hypothetical protein
VEAFVALADAEGEPSIGDAMVMMSWLGIRRQDWLEWPAFDRELIAFSQEKTDVPNVLPWSLVPELVQRVAAAKERRKASGVGAHLLPRSRRPAVGECASLYYVGLVDGDPLAVPTSKLTIRTMRHTCVTLNFDAGVPPNLIGGITGHSPDKINDILAHYRARTADQAAAALELHMAHEAKKSTGG